MAPDDERFERPEPDDEERFTHDDAPDTEPEGDPSDPRLEGGTHRA